MAFDSDAKPLTAQQERFCQLVAQGMSQTDAYEAAGYRGSRKALGDNASRLIENDRVASRVAELREQAAQNAAVTLRWLIDEAKATYLAAKSDRAHSAATGALKELGILTGHRVEKRDNTNRNVNDVSDLTREELFAIALGGREGAASTGSGPRQPH